MILSYSLTNSLCRPSLVQSQTCARLFPNVKLFVRGFNVAVSWPSLYLFECLTYTEEHLELLLFQQTELRNVFSSVSSGAPQKFFITSMGFLDII